MTRRGLARLFAMLNWHTFVSRACRIAGGRTPLGRTRRHVPDAWGAARPGRLQRCERPAP